MAPALHIDVHSTADMPMQSTHTKKTEQQQHTSQCICVRREERNRCRHDIIYAHNNKKFVVCWFCVFLSISLSLSLSRFCVVFSVAAMCSVGLLRRTAAHHQSFREARQCEPRIVICVLHAPCTVDGFKTCFLGCLIRILSFSLLHRIRWPFVPFGSHDPWVEELNDITAIERERERERVSIWWVYVWSGLGRLITKLHSRRCATMAAHRNAFNTHR